MVPYLDLERSKIYVTYIIYDRESRIFPQNPVSDVYQASSPVNNISWLISWCLFGPNQVFTRGNEPFLSWNCPFFHSKCLFRVFLNIWIYHWWENGYFHQLVISAQTGSQILKTVPGNLNSFSSDFWYVQSPSVQTLPNHVSLSQNQNPWFYRTSWNCGEWTFWKRDC